MELTELNGDPTIITSRESVPLMAEDIIGEEVGNILIYPHSVCHGDADQRIVDDVSRIHIPKNMVPFAENLDQVVLPSPSRGETVLDRCVVELSMNLCEVSQSRRRPLLGPSPG